MTEPEGTERVEEIRQRRARHTEVLDCGGTELALVGDDIDWLLTRLREVERERDAIREVNHVFSHRCEQAEQRVAEVEAAVNQSFHTMLHLPMCGCDHEQNDLACHVGLLRAALAARGRRGHE